MAELTISKALELLEANLPNRDVDCLIHGLSSAIKGFKPSWNGPVPETAVPLYTADDGAAFRVLDKFMPHVSWRLEYDMGQGVYRFQSGLFVGRARTRAVAICKGLLAYAKTMAVQPRNDAADALAYALAAGRCGTDKSRPELPTPIVKLDCVAGLSGKALETFLRIKDARWLTPESSDDDICGAASAFHVAPRDIVDDLDAIRQALKLYREPKKDATT